MALEIRQHIELRGKNPLAALVAGTHYRAYVVANLAFNDGPQAFRRSLRHTSGKCMRRRRRLDSSLGFTSPMQFEEAEY